jgi:hypothetical protein
MRSFSSLAVVLAIAAMACFSSPAFATAIFQDDFEGHTVGTALTATTPNPVGTSYAGNWAIMDASTTPPGVAASGTGFTGMAATMDVGQALLSPADTAAVTGKVVQFNFDYYAVSAYPTSSSDLITFNSGMAERGWDIMLYGNGSVKYYNADVAGGGMVAAGAAGSFAANTWVPVQLVADYTAHTFQATVGAYSFSGAWAAGGASTFDKVYMCGNGNTRFFVDNLSVQMVPEPSSLALIATGLLGLLAYAWRTRK